MQKEIPSDELQLDAMNVPSPTSNDGRKRSTKKRVTSKRTSKGDPILEGEEDDDDCITVDGVQVGGQFGKNKIEKAKQYQGDDDDEDDADRYNNYNPGNI